MSKTIILSPWQIDDSCGHTISHYVRKMAKSAVIWQDNMPEEAPINLLPNNKSGIFIFADNQLNAVIWCEDNIPTLPIENIIIRQVKPPFKLNELGQNIVELCNDILQSDKNKGVIELSKQVTLNITRRQLICTKGLNKSDVIIELTEKETDLLSCLKQCKKPNKKYISRETLLEKVWAYNSDIDTHTIETHIYRLRSKIAELNADLGIQSEDGGYFLS